MRFIVKIAIPTATENPVVSRPDFENELTRLYLSVGAREAYSDTQDGRRIDCILVDIADEKQITPSAKKIFDYLKVKIELLPEMTPEPLYGF